MAASQKETERMAMTDTTDKIIGQEVPSETALNSDRRELVVKPTTKRIYLKETGTETDRPKKRDTKIPTGESPSYRFLARVSDRSGQNLIMLALFALVFASHSRTYLWLIVAAASIIVIRSLACTFFASTNVLNHRGVRSSLTQTAKEETAIGIIFLAVCYLFGWPLTPFMATLFLIANLVAHGVVTVFVSELVIKESGATLNWPESKLQNVIIVGTGQSALDLADRIMDQSELAARVTGFVDYHRQGLWRYRDIPIIGHPEELFNLVGDQQVDCLLIALEPEEIPVSRDLFGLAETMGIPVGLVADWYDQKIAQARGDRIDRIPVVQYHSGPSSRAMLTVKWGIDRVLAAVGLAVLSPLLLLTALIVKLTSRGPVFFKQIRSGFNGRPFAIYKFRTMEIDAETRKAQLMDQNEMSGPVFKIASDPRITPVGRYLRKYSIDELPQLINIVKGEMSLVGPRPPLPTEVAGMEPWQRRKLSVKPGVTCSWQVNGRNAIDFEEWMRLDLAYIDNWSLLTDLKLIAQTIPAVIRGSGT